MGIIIYIIATYIIILNILGIKNMKKEIKTFNLGLSELLLLLNLAYFPLSVILVLFNLLKDNQNGMEFALGVLALFTLAMDLILKGVVHYCYKKKRKINLVGFLK